MDLTNEQIKTEFKRQVRLCGGIGRKEMLSIIDQDDRVGIKNLQQADVMHRFFKPAILWEWTDIALCFRVYQQTDFSDYHIGIDIQILWFNLWVQCFRKTCA